MLRMLSGVALGKNHKEILLAMLCSISAALGYGMLLINGLNFGFNCNQRLVIYYSIVAIPGIAFFIIEHFIYKKQVRISRIALGILLLACATTMICSVSTQTFLVSRFIYATHGMSNQEIIEYFDPDLAKFIDESVSKIPENENIVLFNGSFFVNYYLYPRKIFKYSSASSLQDVPGRWLEEKNIKWVMSYNSTHFSLKDARLNRLV